MILEDFHVHTSYCDGKNTPEELVRAAIGLNMKKIGLVHHSYTAFDESYCIKKSGEEAFFNEIQRLRRIYGDRIEILCGIEQDIFSDMPKINYDYVIGSVHYIEADGKYYPVDESPEVFKKVAANVFGGDYLAFAERYFETVSSAADKMHPDIIGHFDLISKFNEGGTYFDENDKRYVNAAFCAAEKLLKYNVLFEVNTGAVSRGYRSVFYPSRRIAEKIAKLGGKFILSSDAHAKENICFDFEKAENFISACGGALQKL